MFYSLAKFFSFFLTRQELIILWLTKNVPPSVVSLEILRSQPSKTVWCMMLDKGADFWHAQIFFPG